MKTATGKRNNRKPEKTNSECAEESDGKLTRFVSASSFGADSFRVTEITGAGRTGWKTENEGFGIFSF